MLTLLRYLTEIEMNFEKTVSNKGNEMLIFNDFKFRKFRILSSGNISWRCSQKKCSAMLETNQHVSEIIKAKDDHNHDEVSYNFEFVSVVRLLRIKLKL